MTWVILLAGISGCADILRIEGQHAPLYRAAPHPATDPSTITVTANAAVHRHRCTANNPKSCLPTGGVRQIDIWAIVGDISSCNEYGFLSVVPCRQNAQYQVRTPPCVFPQGQETAVCTLDLTLGDQQIVTYQGIATSYAGKQAATVPVTYAAGAPLTSVSIGGTSVPWEVARPVWWHTPFETEWLSPASMFVAKEDGVAQSGDHINVGLFPDADYATYAAFTNDVTDQNNPASVMPLVFFNSTQTMAITYTSWLRIFDLWAGPTGADASGVGTDKLCGISFSAWATVISSIMDGRAVFHDTPFRDCAHLGPRGEASNNGRRQMLTPTSLTNFPHMTFIHESGHHLYGLGDEYMGGGHSTQSTPANLFDSEDDCKQSIVDEGFAGATCVAVDSSWRIDTACPEIMGNYGPGSQWCDSSGKALFNTFNACLAGKCFQ